MRTVIAIAHCLLLASCANYTAPQPDAAPFIARDSMRYYRPLPRKERLVSTCDMDLTTKVVTCH